MFRFFTTLLLSTISTALALTARADDATGHDLVIENVSASPISKLGSSVAVSGTIRNKGTLQAVNPMILYTINDGDPQRKLNSVKIDAGGTYDFTVNVPTKTVTADGTVTITLEATWRDGSADDTPADNTASIKVYLTSAAPNHRMLVEEGTGTWCGWCVKGIVGLKKMAEKYGDRFIPIAVHTKDDPMVCEAYAYFITDVMGITAYPTCWINREPTGRNPNFTYIEPWMTAMEKYSLFDVDVTADYSDEAVSMTAHVTPLLSTSRLNNYHIVFAITEDGIPGVQQNFYFDGNSGEMGGFEKLPMYVNLDFEFVARGMWPDSKTTNLAPFRLPNGMEGGQTYDLSYSISTSDFDHSDLSRCSVIAMLIDSKTGYVVNSAKYDPQKLAGLHTVMAPSTTASRAYNLSGQPATQRSGITISGGRKSIRQ